MDTLAGAWIVDAGQGQLKTIAAYTPIGNNKFAATETVFNFDWTLGGLKPDATHGTSLTGIVEENNKEYDFTLITYALDSAEKAVYIIKMIGKKIIKDKDTISVENLVMHIYNDPESQNPLSDKSDQVIPEKGVFPPVHEYRIRNI